MKNFNNQWEIKEKNTWSNDKKTQRSDDFWQILLLLLPPKNAYCTKFNYCWIAYVKKRLRAIILALYDVITSPRKSTLFCLYRVLDRLGRVLEEFRQVRGDRSKNPWVNIFFSTKPTQKTIMPIGWLIIYDLSSKGYFRSSSRYIFLCKYFFL